MTDTRVTGVTGVAVAVLDGLRFMIVRLVVLGWVTTVTGVRVFLLFLLLLFFVVGVGGPVVLVGTGR